MNVYRCFRANTESRLRRRAARLCITRSQRPKTRSTPERPQRSRARSADVHETLVLTRLCVCSRLLLLDRSDIKKGGSCSRPAFTLSCRRRRRRSLPPKCPSCRAMYVKTLASHRLGCAITRPESLNTSCVPEQVQGGRQEERLQLPLLSSARDHRDAVRSDRD